jgi:hypothetical protein
MIRAFLSSSRSEQVLVVEVTLLFVVASVALRILTFAGAERAVATIRTALPGGGREVDRDRIQWAVRVVANTLPGSASCLEKAMTARALLRRYGHPADLRFGVDDEESFAAHAWVESDGEVVVGSAERPEFTELRGPDRR